ncbi:MAG TPA: ScpA family protein [Actinomycetes bacterium]|jgi:segregation and condensation protein A|nr:ScpA family protein [Actinomycetes bacterium]
MDYVVRTEVFEGPFDLLLHLIARQRVDLWQVSVSRITEDYLAEVKRMHELNLEVATEFLVVAATLLELKAARLLPGPDADPDEVEALLSERDLLFARVLQYRAYKHVAALFAARLAEQAGYVPGRAGDTDDLFRQIVPDLLVGTDPEELARLAAGALIPVPVPEVRTSHIASSKLSVNEAITELAGRVRAAGSTTFVELVGSGAMPIEVVVHFLALLELYKRSLVEIEQVAAFGTIAVQWTSEDDPDLTDLAVEEPA